MRCARLSRRPDHPAEPGRNVLPFKACDWGELGRIGEDWGILGNGAQAEVHSVLSAEVQILGGKRKANTKPGKRKRDQWPVGDRPRVVGTCGVQKGKAYEPCGDRKGCDVGEDNEGVSVKLEMGGSDRKDRECGACSLQ